MAHDLERATESVFESIAEGAVTVKLCDAELTVSCEDCGVHMSREEPCAVIRCICPAHPGATYHIGRLDGRPVIWEAERRA